MAFFFSFWDPGIELFFWQYEIVTVYQEEVCTESWVLFSFFIKNKINKIQGN